MKIQILSPNYPPQKCGVGDYSFFLSEEFSRQGVETTVFTRTQMEKKGKADLALLSNFTTQGIDENTTTIIQYTPQLFNSFLECLKIFQKAKGPVWINFHELYFPPSLSLHGLLIGIPHWIRFVALLHLADQVVFSTSEFYLRWTKRLPYLKGKMHWIPVGSNIPVVSKVDSSSEDAEYRLFHFGGAHPTHLYDYIFEAFLAVLNLENGSRYRLILAGVSQEALKDILNNYPSLMNHPQISYLGYLSAEEVSLSIQNADLVLAPFMDGVSTRRGSLMAALSHGKRVITTVVAGDDSSDIPWADFLETVELSGDAKLKFSRKVVQLVNESKVQRKVFELKAVEAFQKLFSWDVIAKKFLSIKRL